MFTSNEYKIEILNYELDIPKRLRECYLGYTILQILGFRGVVVITSV